MSSRHRERSDREVLIEDILRVVAGLELPEPGQGLVRECVMQALRPAVCLKAEVEAVQGRTQLVPVPAEVLRVRANRRDVEVLVAVGKGGGLRVRVVDCPADRADRDEEDRAGIQSCRNPSHAPLIAADPGVWPAQ